MDENLKLFRVKEFVYKYKFLTNGGLRDKIHKSYLNRMDEFKVILRIGRNVYINESNFFKWLEAINE